MSRRSMSWVGVVAFASACGAAPEEEASEEIGTERLAAEIAYDRPAAAALQVHGPGAHAWVFACDSSNRLQRNIRELSTNWNGWEVLLTDCPTPPVEPSVPSAAKWHNAGSGTDSVILYVRRADNHLWEAYWPDATNSPNSVSWADLSAITGFGNIVGSPVVADTDQTGRASVVVRKASNNELHTFDWDGGWTTRKVISSGSTAIRTANTVTARAQKTAGFLTFIAGRGLSSTDDATGWIATRSHGSWGTSYTRNANFDHTPNGTPFPASVPELETNLNNYLVARNGSALQAKIIQSGTSWFNLGSCQPTGSPRGASNPYFDPAIDDRGEFLEGFARGRLAGSSENDDLLRWRGLPTNECVSLGGGVYSAPVKFEYVTRFSGLRFNAVYRGTNARLMMWDHLNSQHTHISGITMPGLPP